MFNPVKFSVATESGPVDVTVCGPDFAAMETKFDITDVLRKTQAAGQTIIKTTP